MPASERVITTQDLLADADYARVRKERRAALLPLKRLRRVSLGPYCTLIFESYDTMLFQVQEMLPVPVEEKPATEGFVEGVRYTDKRLETDKLLHKLRGLAIARLFTGVLPRELGLRKCSHRAEATVVDEQDLPRRSRPLEEIPHLPRRPLPEFVAPE